ncbi:TPA: DNA primase [Enterococcus faecalis]|uniref:DNA primase n=1 Tax=Enterococcus TaxID=1350 RepID=UPI0001B2BE25|nr:MULTISPECIES: DNA primase [Enterococcus]HAP3745454.1 DNA primase [Enterococcus faecalis TDR28]HAP3751383.1 DNA primase [Enterococcus faecalis TDR22]HAP3754383.1 DNA primase [Enterococcus faecalis TDR13]HAP3757367.1 DNA primase [Enterococcus faecalis TDR7]HAP3768236.1 DNA primase [Enterococcus faecalis TDR19]HAP4961275.1 DNA primase [Enterococcus faecalis ADL-336]
MAQRIPQEVIEEVRHRTNIVDIIGQYVQLKKSGKNYMGLCPFHEERSPSFSVAEDKQIFHCFGCGKGGTVFNFLQEIEGISFPESVKRVADLEHLSVDFDWSEPREVADTPENQQRRSLLQLHSKAAELYHHILVNTKIGEPALNYLLERGLTQELIETFQIGFAPQKRDFLSQVFKNEQLDEALFEPSGLFVQRDNGTFLDRFYQRIMFPINDPQGNVIAFSGRLLKTADFPGDEMPKYLNSPETTLFNKRETLFNFDKARKEIRKENTVLLFEGFMDVIAAWQSGVKSGVASMGTSLTNEQIRRLERVAKEVVICYDGDNAGVQATNRAIQLLQENSHFDLSIVSIPEKLDPDEYVRKYGAEAFQNLANHGRETVFSFKMNYHRLTRNMNNEKEQLDYVNELLRELTNVQSPLERDRYLNQIAQEFQLSVHSLEEQFNQLKQAQRSVQRQERQQFYQDEMMPPPMEEPVFEENHVQNKLPLTQVQKAERSLLFRLMNEQGVRQTIQQLPDFSFAHDEYQELYFLLESYATLHQSFDIADFINFLQDNQTKQLAIEIAYQNLSEESSEREVADLLHVIALSSIAEAIEQKKIQQQEAKRVGNQQLEAELTMEIIQLARQLKAQRTFT